MVGDQTPISSTPLFGRSTRGPTRLRYLSLRHASGEKTQLDIDVNIGVTSGPNSDTFSSYLGVFARERVFILTNSWDDMIEVDQNMLWEDALVMYTLLLLSYIAC